MNQKNEDGLVKSKSQLSGLLLKAFIFGAIFGQILFYGLLHYVNDSSTWVKFVAYPAYIVRYVNTPLHWLCDLFNSNLCIGLGLDGGPLEWVEWATAYTAMSVAYGLLFVVIYVIFHLLSKQRMDPVDQVN